MLNSIPAILYPNFCPQVPFLYNKIIKPYIPRVFINFGLIPKTKLTNYECFTSFSKISNEALNIISNKYLVGSDCNQKDLLMFINYCTEYLKLNNACKEFDYKRKTYQIRVDNLSTLLSNNMNEMEIIYENRNLLPYPKTGIAKNITMLTDVMPIYIETSLKGYYAAGKYNNNVLKIQQTNGSVYAYPLHLFCGKGTEPDASIYDRSMIWRDLWKGEKVGGDEAYIDCIGCRTARDFHNIFQKKKFKTFRGINERNNWRYDTFSIFRQKVRCKGLKSIKKLYRYVKVIGNCIAIDMLIHGAPINRNLVNI